MDFNAENSRLQHPMLNRIDRYYVQWSSQDSSKEGGYTNELQKNNITKTVST